MRHRARPQLIDEYLPKVEEWVERSTGKVRADRAHEKLLAMGYTGSERTTRRAVAGRRLAGYAYDNAMAESQIGLYRAELIWPEGPWRDREHVELETLNYADWFNKERSHESIDDLTPRQVEEIRYAARNRLRPTG